MEFILRGHRTLDEWEREQRHQEKQKAGIAIHKRCLELLKKYPLAAECGGTMMPGSFWSQTQIRSNYDDEVVDLMKEAIRRTLMHCDDDGNWVDCRHVEQPKPQHRIILD